MSGPRYTVEYTGGGAGADDSGADAGGRAEPAFIRQFKQRAGLLPDAKLTDKFASAGGSNETGRGLGKARAADDDGGREPAARSEEEMPQIVVTADSGITEAELAAVEARIREAGDEAKFDEARSRVRFVRPVAGGGGGGSNGRKTKAGAVIGAGGFSNPSDDATSAKRSRPAVGSATATPAKTVCDKKLLSFDDEEGDD